MDQELFELKTTGIGSLPHLDPLKALDSAFRTEIPFYPTLPQRHREEGMLNQALAGIPGLKFLSETEWTLEKNLWLAERETALEKLREAVNRNNYQAYLPSPETSVWEPFWQRLSQAPSLWAKTQLVGPLTLGLTSVGLEEWSESERVELVDFLQTQLFVKAMAMHSAIKLQGKRSLIFLDEPCLAGADLGQAWPGLFWTALKDLVLDLSNQGMELGLHCCGDADFKPCLDLKIRILSFDSALSLARILRDIPELPPWLEQGGRLALGAVPTALPDDWDTRRLAEELRRALARVGWNALRSSLLTPACGLGLKTPKESERVLGALQGLQSSLRYDSRI